MERYACQFSLTIVALGAIGFVAEVFHALEYIKGIPIISIWRLTCLHYCNLIESMLSILGTRLALVRFNKTVAAGLLVMSLVRLALLYLKESPENFGQQT